MNIRIQDGLPFVSVILEYRGQSITLEKTLLDTGSAGTLICVDRILDIGLQYEPNDQIYRIYGVGGSEFVYAKQVDRVMVGDLTLSDFEVEVGTMDYGLELDAILGVDFLGRVGAVINFSQLTLLSELM